MLRIKYRVSWGQYLTKCPFKKTIIDFKTQKNKIVMVNDRFCRTCKYYVNHNNSSIVCKFPENNT